ncbi:hypothetical protein P167DRAFT_144715 [Morchella conica CCBAS932]|uniref:Uncharacterized protein n=1 Tax=Morchella conica CCBAS932 TaxID=1392247 RepID=A0A3N4KQP0_9PEZI|nr:hypothetical protein P167DRAFT_144715 [Morchella conica CCBAS932]
MRKGWGLDFISSLLRCLERSDFLILWYSFLLVYSTIPSIDTQTTLRIYEFMMHWRMDSGCFVIIGFFYFYFYFYFYFIPPLHLHLNFGALDS